MSTARIAVLTIALGAGGVAAHLASRSENKPPPADPVAELQTVDVLVARSAEQAETLAARQTGTLSLALRSITDINAPATGYNNINVVRYGVPSPTTIQN
jgi:Flp pilus assembly protein CpaB